MHKNIVLPAIIFIAVFSLFSRSLQNNFVYDDKFRIVANQTIKKTINPIYYFTHPDAGRPLDGIEPDVYRPLSLWFLSLEYKMFGSDPFYYHLLNLLIHSGNAVLFFLLLKKILGKEFMAAFGALLFGVHPVTTESAAWAIQQNNLWSWFFALLVLNSAFSKSNKFFNKNRIKLLMLAILSFVSVFSKEQAVVLPFIYFLCLFYFKSGIFHTFKDIFKSGWKEFGAIIFPVVLYILFRAIFMGSFVQQEPWGSGRYSIFLTMVNGFVYYLKLLVWPYPLSVNYDAFPIVRGLADNYVIFSIFILALIIFTAIILWRRLPLFSLGIFWIFVVLLPVSNFILPTKQIINERFIYFALPGFIISVLGLFSYQARILFFEQTKHSNILKNIGMFCERKRVNYIGYAILIAAAVLIILTAFSTLTFMRLGDWKNELTLWEHEIAIKPNDWRNQKNYAWALESENKTKESIKHYEFSLELAHNSDLALKSVNVWAIAYIRANKPQKAVEIISEALKDFPDNDALLYTLGQAHLKNKQYGEAEKIFLRLSEKNNDEDVALFFAVLSQKLEGKKDEEKINIAKIKNPRFREQALLLIQGREKMLEKKWQEAVSLFITGLKITQSPIIEPYLWLAESFEKSGEKEKALAVYDLTLSVYPLSIDALQGIKRMEQ